MGANRSVVMKKDRMLAFAARCSIAVQLLSLLLLLLLTITKACAKEGIVDLIEQFFACRCRNLSLQQRFHTGFHYDDGMMKPKPIERTNTNEKKHSNSHIHRRWLVYWSVSLSSVGTDSVTFYFTKGWRLHKSKPEY